MTKEEVLSLTPDERIAEIARRYADIIALIGEDPEREGLVKTPLRAAKALWFCTGGYRTDPAETAGTDAWSDARASVNGTFCHTTAIFGMTLAGLVIEDLYCNTHQ